MAGMIIGGVIAFAGSKFFFKISVGSVCVYLSCLNYHIINDIVKDDYLDTSEILYNIFTSLIVGFIVGMALLSYIKKWPVELFAGVLFIVAF